MQTVLVLNSGSSSVKFALFCVDADGVRHLPLCEGNASRLLETGQARLTWLHDGTTQARELPESGHECAIRTIVFWLREQELLETIAAVGHRVVHGGEHFRTPTLIDDSSLAAIARCCDYAPLHNPANLTGIRIAQTLLSGVPQVAVFDTAFHSSLPAVAYQYAVPADWHTRLGVRRYGFHGTSHQYIAQSLPMLTGLPADNIRAVSAHLGNGCSTCAIHGQRSVDTSMGFTPLEGLVMGSRSGDLDPGLHEYLCDKLGVNIRELTAMLNRDAGLKGVSGISNDMRELLQAARQGHASAQLAIDLFCYRLAKTIAACTVPLGRINAIAFTGGIGENAAAIRAQVIALLHGLGFAIDAEKNTAADAGARNIAAASSSPVLIIPTREEWMIACQTLQRLANTGIHA